MPFLINILLGLGALVLTIIFHTFAGAFCAWIIGWFFGGIILGIVAQFGLHNIVMWQLGAFLGFISGFFNRTVTVNK